jgi:uncharacterized protein (TIGR02147 family)
MAIFDFDTFDSYFDDILSTHKSDRGYRTKLARAARVHPSYITRIVDGNARITPDQGAALADFWGLIADEKEFFHWLIVKGRAGDPALKSLADRRLRDLREQNRELGRSLPAEENAYYMNWIYSAIHILGTVPGMTVQQAQRRLGIPAPVALAAARTLRDLRMISLGKDGSIRHLKANVHLSNQGWMASMQHRNWRVASMERMGRPGAPDVRYTGVHSLSKRDLEKLRRQIQEFLVQTDKLVRPSAEETACVLCLDLFEL